MIACTTTKRIVGLSSGKVTVQKTWKRRRRRVAPPRQARPGCFADRPGNRGLLIPRKVQIATSTIEGRASVSERSQLWVG